jgi:hypothetical protein
MRTRVAPLVLAAALLAPAVAHAQGGVQVDHVQPVSGATPFPSGCGVPGDQTVSSEAEPSLAADPADSRHLVATWQQDRFAVDGGALSDLVAVSHDAGATWSGPIRVPGISRCTGGRDERASDPWVSIGPDGRTYLATLSFSETPAGMVGAAGPTASANSVSTDGGQTWAEPVQVVNDGVYDDRESVSADPFRPGRAYFASVRRLGGFGESGLFSFSTTTDDGKTWSPERTVLATGPGTLPDPILIGVRPDGTLVAVYVVINSAAFLPSPAKSDARWDVMAVHSKDGGGSWSDPVKVTDISPIVPSDPDSGSEVRALPVVSATIGPDGAVDIAYNDIASSSSSQIRLQRSTDAGASWSAPTTIAQISGQAFLPSLAVMPDGTLGVTWDDTRNDRPGDNQLTADVWFAHSEDRGVTWQQAHVAGPFDLLGAAPTSSTGVEGHFVGDYQALVGGPDGFGALFAVARPLATAGPSDVFFAHIGFSGGSGARPTGRRARISLRVRPRIAVAGRRTRFTFLATRPPRRSIPVVGATVRFAGHRATTNPRGRASIVATLRRRGRRHATAALRGLRRGTAAVRVAAR